MPVFEDTTITHNVELVAAFRAWVGKWEKALEEVGLVRTSDTGQINPEAVELPAISTFAGYSMWKFPDALQATQPVFIRLDYGRGAAVTRPRLKFQVGRGSNGSGTLTTANTAVSSEPAGTPSGQGIVYACYHDGMFVMHDCNLTSSTGAGNNAFFTVERIKAPDYSAIDAIATLGSNAESSLLKNRQLFSSGSWADAIVVVTGASRSATGMIIPAYCYITSAIPTAPFRTVMAFLPDQVGQGDTGNLEPHNAEFEYMRPKCEYQAVNAGGSTAAGVTTPHQPLLLHET